MANWFFLINIFQIVEIYSQNTGFVTLEIPIILTKEDKCLDLYKLTYYQGKSASAITYRQIHG